MAKTRRKQEEQLATALASQRLTGRREGAQAEREALIEQTAAALLRDDVAAAAALVEEHGAEKAVPLIAVAAREAWTSKWRERLAPFVLRVMQDADLITDKGPVKLGFDVKNPKLAAYFDGYMAELSGGVTDTTRGQVTDAIRKGLDEGEGIPQIANRIRQAGDEFSGYRSKLIARDQTLKASRGASYLQAKQSGVVKSKTRRSAGDSRVRPEHRAIDGETVPINEPYSNGEMVSGDQSVQCRCVDIYQIDTEALRGRVA